ncbi:adenylyltransferase/cytidyltransferase family protein [Candidatus Woesearchaeota archaeon]|nr:adenylyltransferase/cytidyltransferase family protein [Candidatus Woesearchaeota archaeon]
MKQMKKVMCFGTFDLLHLGHLHYLEQAKEHGDYLIVVIARDATKQQQRKETIFTEKERLKLIQSLKIVDEAVLGYPDDHFHIIQDKKPDVICLGYDHQVREKDIAEKLASLELHPEIMRLQPYKPTIHKSTKLREKVLKSNL